MFVLIYPCRSECGMLDSVFKMDKLGELTDNHRIIGEGSQHFTFFFSHQDVVFTTQVVLPPAIDFGFHGKDHARLNRAHGALMGTAQPWPLMEVCTDGMANTPLVIPISLIKTGFLWPGYCQRQTYQRGSIFHHPAKR